MQLIINLLIVHSLSHFDLMLRKGNSRNSEMNLILKREAISNYMFYLAFENSIETGYVTEKLFDGLIAGTVPIYLGSAPDAKKLIPHPKAVIFLEDFKVFPLSLGLLNAIVAKTP